MKKYLLLLLLIPVYSYSAPILLVGYSPDVASVPGITAGPIDSTGSNADVTLFFNTGVFSLDLVNVSPDQAGATDAAGAVSNNTYFQFQISTDPGLVLDLASLTFGAYKGGASDPRGWVLRTDVDSYAADVSTGLTTCDPGGGCVGPDPFSVDLTGSQFQGLSSINFRIYSFSPVPDLNVINYTGLELNGMLTAVPEPSILSLFILGLIGLGITRRN